MPPSSVSGHLFQAAHSLVDHADWTMGKIHRASGSIVGPAAGDSAAAFAPPTAEQLEAHLEAHAPKSSPLLNPWPLVAGVGAALVGFVIGGTLGLMSGLLVVAVGISVWTTMQTRRVRRLQREAGQVHELALVRWFPEALRLAWRLLPELRQQPAMHFRVAGMVAQVLEELNESAAALAGYQHVLAALPKEHRMTLRLRLQAALMLVGDDRLADTEDALRGLHRAMGNHQEGLVARYVLTRLRQAVRTLHLREAIAMVDQPPLSRQTQDTAEDETPDKDASPAIVPTLRPLGLEAALGYGLLALAHVRLAEFDQGPW